MASISREPSMVLPWSDSADQGRFLRILSAFLVLVLVLGIVIPMVTLPEPSRDKLAKVPPQLARVLERKKQEAPKPKPKPPEPKKEPPTPKPKPKPKPEVVKPPKPIAPKPQPKPARKPVVKATQQQREKAKAKAKETFGKQALSELSALRSQLPLADLAVNNKDLSNSGQQAADIGSVVDRSVAEQGSGGVSTDNLSQAVSGETLATREVTQVEASADVQQAKVDASTRSEEEVRLVFERYNPQFDKIYRRMLRKDPTLEGTVALKLTIAPNGKVTQCQAVSKDITNKGLLKRLVSKCKRMAFKNRPEVKAISLDYPIKLLP